MKSNENAATKEMLCQKLAAIVVLSFPFVGRSCLLQLALHFYYKGHFCSSSTEGLHFVVLR